RRTWTGPLVYTGLWLALTGFRLAYYGAPLPNTFYAKAGGAWLGLSTFFVLLFALGNGAPAAIPAAFALRDRRAWPGAAFALLLLAYGAWVGGVPRYLVPLVPCLAALGAWGAAACWARGGARAGIALASLALATALAFFGLALPRRDGG